ncbi:MAG TPA: acid phosphatase [Burkholderiaceae bacterium]
MKHPALPSALLFASLLAACAATPGTDYGGEPATVRGVAHGYPGVRVCIDRNANARCDAGEPQASADANGTFELPVQGALAAEVASPSGTLVLRSPIGANRVLSPLTTELAALVEATGSYASARATLAKRLGIAEGELLAPSSAAARAAVERENAQLVPRIAQAVAAAGANGDRSAALRNRLALDAVDTLVVIYAENRSFDNMYGLFPGANGIPGRNPSSTGTVYPQKDFDGSVLPVLPPAWGGLTAGGQPATVTQAQSSNLPNAMFQIDDPKGIGASGVVVGQQIITRDLVHRYYSNMLQINGGRNDGFAAWSDAGGLSMGYYDGSSMKLWKIAQQYVLADNFFMGAFGGSFLNHQYLICGCAPTYPNADAADSPAKDSITQIETDAQGRFKRFIPADNMPASALSGAPRHKRDSTLTPKDASGMFYAVNTMQPAYQPSGVQPAAGGDARLADPSKPTTLPPQTQTTIADTLDAKGVSWAWYAGGWNTVSSGTPEGRKQIYSGQINFQTHHQPFNYYASFDPAKNGAARAQHLKDFDTSFLADAAAGKLPAVTFYKPQGNLNQHAGYANLSDGDAHIADVIAKLQASPQWPRMLIVVTYDENGGFYDHAAVPAGDRWGPGSRIPAIIVSPFAKKGYVDKTQYDTGSILRFITHRWSLATLPGIAERDAGLAKNGSAAMGDLSGALEIAPATRRAVGE